MKSFYLALAALAFSAAFGTAQAATVSGMQCGNKYIGLTQNGTELAPAMCQSGNSTGGPNSPIGQLGWIDSSEYDGSTDDSGPVKMVISQANNTWSLLNPQGYNMLGISIKQGNGFAFYVLDATAPLLGKWFTGNSANPMGNSVSHINAWYKGDPKVPPVPLPAAGWMLLAALGGLAASRRRGNG